MTTLWKHLRIRRWMNGSGLWSGTTSTQCSHAQCQAVPYKTTATPPDCSWSICLSLEAFRARLGGAVGSLVWWEVSVPTAAGWNYMVLELPIQTNLWFYMELHYPTWTYLGTPPMPWESPRIIESNSALTACPPSVHHHKNLQKSLSTVRAVSVSQRPFSNLDLYHQLP